MVDLLLPPASLALLAMMCLLLWRGRGRAVAAGLLALLVVLSVPAVAMSLLAMLDPVIELVPEPVPGAAATGVIAPGSIAPGAIVILSADVEWTGTDGLTDLGAMTLERERAGAVIARRTGLPVLVTGGVVTAPPAVAALMVGSMVSDFGIAVRWAEVRSGTTWENARFSAPLLREAGISRVYLVTHGWHMRRSLLAFSRAGIDAVPVVVRRDPWPHWEWQMLIPRVSAWSRSYLALHEWLGLFYYRVRS